jgi:methionyl-tRNA formyltransferase
VTGGRAGGSRMRTVFLGSGAFGIPTLRWLAGHPDAEVVGVVTAQPRQAGRRQAKKPTEVDAAARALGVPTVLTPWRLRAPEAVASVLELEPGLAVLADYGQLVPPSLLDLPHGALNLHPSLLPRYRGATPIPAAILAGDTETGVSLMRMDEGLDTGPIVARLRQPLTGRETAPDLETRLAERAADLLADNLGAWLRGEINPEAQPTDGATLTRRLTRQDGRLDPGRPGLELERQVRAYQPWPGSFVDTAFGRIVVWSARPEASRETANGVFDERGLGVGDEERLWLMEVQPAGGERMTWEAFLRGHPGIVGTSALASDS